MSVKKGVLAVDIDETLVDDLVATLLVEYNKKYNDNVKFEDITEYNIQKFLKPECKDIFAEFANEELFEKLKPKEGSYVLLNFLNNYYNIYFLTAGDPITMPYRDKWLKKYYDSFYKSRRLVMCKDKFLFNCDILIDDCQENLKWMPSKCMKILFNQPWNTNFNAELNGMFRVNDWTDIWNLLAEDDESKEREK